MVSKTTPGDLVSNRYASALYDLASDSNKVDLVLKDILSIQSLLNENKNLNFVIKSPLISSLDKLEILEKLLKKISVNKLTLTFLYVIEKNKRFSNLLSIVSQFININSQKRGDILAEVTSADQLNEEQKNTLKEQIKIILGDKLSLNFNVDKKIIGGLVVKVGSKMIDISLANKINKLKIAMKGA